MNVYITGIGIISSIGNNQQETLDSLVEARSGIKPISILDTRYRTDWVAGEVLMTSAQLQQLAQLGDVDVTRTTLLGMIAMREAITQAGLDDPASLRDTPLLSATTVAGMVKTEWHYQDFLDRTNQVSFIKTHDNGFHAEFISNYFGCNEFCTTINTACSSSANSIILGARMIRNQKFKKVIAGGTDAFCKYTFNGFNSLLLIDKEPCRPFDKNRKGINLGEGAAYLVLESEESLMGSGKTPICQLSGYSNTNDAYHQTAVSPTGYGVHLAMEKSLNMAALQPADIGYINAHGTATANNDLTEGVAIRALFGDQPPPFSSTKSFTGHTLGAAGAIEAVIAALSIQYQVAFPNLRFSEPIPDHLLEPITTAKNTTIEHVLSNSVGIGGFCSSLIFSKLS